MDQDNEQAQEDVVEQEEQTSEEDTDYSSEEEETVTIPKAKFNNIRRKAQAFDANKSKPQKPIINNSDAKWRERMELKVDGFDDQAVEFLMKNGGKKALENPFVVKALEGIKEQKIAEQATIDSGTTSETEARFNPKDFAKLSASEQLKVLSDL